MKKQVLLSLDCSGQCCRFLQVVLVDYNYMTCSFWNTGSFADMTDKFSPGWIYATFLNQEVYTGIFTPSVVCFCMYLFEFKSSHAHAMLCTQVSTSKYMCTSYINAKRCVGWSHLVAASPARMTRCCWRQIHCPWVSGRRLGLERKCGQVFKLLLTLSLVIWMVLRMMCNICMICLEDWW